MKVLMLGWEFPPYHSGGLGVASRNIAEALAQQGVEITLALPFFIFDKVGTANSSDRSFALAGHELRNISVSTFPTSIVSPYTSAQEYLNICTDAGISSGFYLYGRTLFAEVERYALEMEHFVRGKDFELIHAHDWITFAAALRVKEQLGIPFIAHVHATEYDRTGGNPTPEIFAREKMSLEAAEQLIAVSNYTKNILVQKYSINPEKISVVHNGVEHISEEIPLQLQNDEKTVLFLGRLTVQKGPDWFLKIAERVLAYRQDVQFVIGGVGEMLPTLLQEIARKNLSHRIFCLGFLNALDREKAFALADVYVMPSVSEPFGLSAVEAAQRGIPVILSHQSGVKEVLSHSLTADFWDTDKMANHILAIL